MEHIVEINDKVYKQIADFGIGYNQTWTPNSGRDFSGTWNGTILGNFDTVNLSLLPKDKFELSQLIKDLRSGIIKVKHYEHEAMGMITSYFYRANFEVKSVYLSETENYYEVIDISFIPERKK